MPAEFFVSIFTLTRGRAGFWAFHQSGTRTISPLDSNRGIALRNSYASLGDHARG